MGTPLISNPAPPATDSFGPADLSRLLDHLVNLPPRASRIISCYVRLTPADRRNQAYLRWMKDRVAIVRDSLPTTLSHAEREMVERDLTRILARLEDPERLPAAGGLAIFACEELKLFAEAPMPEALRPRLMIGDTPWVEELVALRPRYHPILVLALDRRHARFFLVTPWKVTETLCVPAVATPAGKFHEDQQDAPGWGERKYHNRIQAEQQQFHRKVAHELDLLCPSPAYGFVVAGPVRETTAFVRHLPGGLRPLLMDVAHANPTHAPVSTIEHLARAGIERQQRAQVQRLLAEFQEQLGNGWATSDMADTLRALNQRQVRALLVASESALRGYRCGKSGHLVLRASDCGPESQATLVSDIIDEAIQEGLRQRVRVITVPEENRGDAVSPLSAVLRYR